MRAGRPPKNPLIAASCPICNASFSYRPFKGHETRICCSVACSNKWRALEAAKNKAPLPLCAQCGKPFEIKTKGAICCSVECSNKLRGEQPETKPCERCGKLFTASPKLKRRFCSPRCRNQQTNDERFGDGRICHCLTCGKEYRSLWHLAGKYCSRACAVKHAIGPNHPSWKGGHVRNPYGPNWNKQREAALERDGHKCQHCGKTAEESGYPLHVHHIRKLRIFRRDYEQANHLSNLITLCIFCHPEAELGHIVLRVRLI